VLALDYSSSPRSLHFGQNMEDGIFLATNAVLGHIEGVLYSFECKAPLNQRVCHGAGAPE